MYYIYLEKKNLKVLQQFDQFVLVCRRKNAIVNLLNAPELKHFSLAFR